MLNGSWTAWIWLQWYSRRYDSTSLCLLNVTSQQFSQMFYNNIIIQDLYSATESEDTEALSDLKPFTNERLQTNLTWTPVETDHPPCPGDSWVHLSAQGSWTLAHRTPTRTEHKQQLTIDLTVWVPPAMCLPAPSTYQIHVSWCCQDVTSTIAIHCSMASLRDWEPAAVWPECSYTSGVCLSVCHILLRYLLSG